MTDMVFVELCLGAAAGLLLALAVIMAGTVLDARRNRRIAKQIRNGTFRG